MVEDILNKRFGSELANQAVKLLKKKKISQVFGEMSIEDLEKELLISERLCKLFMIENEIPSSQEDVVLKLSELFVRSTLRVQGDDEDKKAVWSRVYRNWKDTYGSKDKDSNFGDFFSVFKEVLQTEHDSNQVGSSQHENKHTNDTQLRMLTAAKTVWNTVAFLSKNAETWKRIKIVASILFLKGLTCPWMRGDERGAAGETPLHIAVLFNDTSAKVHALFADLWDLCPKLRAAEYLGDEYKGENVLHFAIIKKGNINLIEMMLDSPEGWELLRSRATGKFFKEAELSEDSCRWLGELPLAFAASTNQREVFDLLLEKGGDLTGTTAGGNNLLHLMVLNASIKGAKVENEADKGQVKEETEAEKIFMEMYSYIKKTAHEKKTELWTMENQSGFTPLQLAAAEGSLSIFNHVFEQEVETLWVYGPVTCKKLCFKGIHYEGIAEKANMLPPPDSKDHETQEKNSGTGVVHDGDKDPAKVVSVGAKLGFFVEAVVAAPGFFLVMVGLLLEAAKRLRKRSKSEVTSIPGSGIHRLWGWITLAWLFSTLTWLFPAATDPAVNAKGNTAENSLETSSEDKSDKKRKNFLVKWGINWLRNVGFDKNAEAKKGINPVLEILVHHDRKEILTFSLIDKVVEEKWNKYGARLFHAELARSVLFLVLIYIAPMSDPHTSDVWRVAHTLIHVLSFLLYLPEFLDEVHFQLFSPDSILRLLLEIIFIFGEKELAEHSSSGEGDGARLARQGGGSTSYVLMAEDGAGSPDAGREGGAGQQSCGPAATEGGTPTDGKRYWNLLFFKLDVAALFGRPAIGSADNTEGEAERQKLLENK